MTKILVIEDDLEISEVIVEMLTEEGYNVLHADNGQVGIEMAEQELPDMIICDVMMPELDGYGVLSHLRQNLITCTIPFLFVTAKATRADQRQGMILGADDYLTKPFTRAELLEAILACLERRDFLQKKAEEKIKTDSQELLRSLPDKVNTALTGILGGSEFLLNSHSEMDKEELIEIIEAIHTSGKSLQKLVKFLLSYSGLEGMADIPDSSAQRSKFTTANRR